jgi:cholesterol oxidase
VSILRASGVGGGSLVYANVTIQPPDFIFDDPRWPPGWKPESSHFYNMARDAIGFGVLHALDQANSVAPPHAAVNTGLSNIATRTARLDPHWPTDAGGHLLKRIQPRNPQDPNNALWLDRARVFQTAMSELTGDYGTVDSSINDIVSEPSPFNPGGAPKNYCERQGRCIVGCLPGARHTLNKQLMLAVLGNPTNAAFVPDFGAFMHIQTLAEVDHVRAVPAGGYEVNFALHDPDKPSRTSSQTVTADKVIVAAGCVGTNEIMLRSQQKGGLPDLSDKLGFGFSTNGDLLAFLPNTKERVSLTKGPITTSYGHFNSDKSGPGADPAHFHTIEDNGIPRALASLAGFGIPTLQTVSAQHANKSGLFLVLSLLPKILKRAWQIIRGPFLNDRKRQDSLISEDEMLANMMCVAAIGRDEAIGQFSLGGRSDTPLRVKRADGKEFKDDPIYDEIRKTLDDFAKKLSNDPDPQFVSPWQTKVAKELNAAPTALSHPLGGCRMADSVDDGVCDQYGRVYDRSKKSEARPYYEGLYIADAALLPTSLGVNPSLTISAVALRAVQAWIRTDLGA